MDRRDTIQEFGTFLQSLPDVEIDEDTMTATFFVESEPPPPPPPPPPSYLEELGMKVDDKIVRLVDRLTKKLYKEGKLNWASRPYDLHEWFPTPPVYKNKADRSSYRPKDYAEDWKDMFRLAIQERSCYRLIRAHLGIIQKQQYKMAGMAQGQENKYQYNGLNNVQIEVVVGEETRMVPGIRFWVAFAAREAQSLGNSPGWFSVYPIQFGIGSAPCPRYP